MISLMLTLRRHLPAVGNYCVQDNIKTGVMREEEKIRPFDKLFTNHVPSIMVDKKNVNIKMIKKYVRYNDYVTVIGGGYGLTAMFAAKGAGPDGKVTIYEADSKSISTVKKTLEMHNVIERCEIIHAIIADAYELISDGETGDVIHPSEINQCDVLEMDCEGAELNIIQNLEIRPRNLIIEQHHWKASSPYSSPHIIPEILSNYGYNVEVKDANIENKIVVATRQ